MKLFHRATVKDQLHFHKQTYFEEDQFAVSTTHAAPCLARLFLRPVIRVLASHIIHESAPPSVSEDDFFPFFLKVRKTLVCFFWRMVFKFNSLQTTHN